ncbi:MAG: dihydrolipoamide dehydrogenase precursor [Chaenotheca gracillima]|nr:MAG: dihydrolipoamide dehydrogenase precursor [Chaenotheca gracillima]
MSTLYRGRLVREATGLIVLVLLALSGQAIAGFNGLGVQLPFNPIRKPNHAHMPVNTNHTFGDSPTQAVPAFKYNTQYLFKITLNATADTYSFTDLTPDGQPPDISGVDASGLVANVSVQLAIDTFGPNVSPEPGRLLFQAAISVPECEVVQGNPIGSTGLKVIKSSATTGEACLPEDTTVPRPLVWVTQDTTSGEFQNVYYNVTSDPTPAMDSMGFQKLIVASLKTIQAYHENLEYYEHEVKDRSGNVKTVAYSYLGKLGDNPCWQVESETVNEDAYENENRTMCWSTTSGGVVNSASGDAVELGTKRIQALVVEDIAVSSGLFITTSQDDTLELSSLTMQVQSPNANFNVTDIGFPSTPMFGSTTEEVFLLGDNGVLWRRLYLIQSGSWVLNETTQGYAGQPTPFSALSGGPLIDISNSLNHAMYAIDAVGAIWVCSAQNAVDRGPWTSITNPEDMALGLRAVGFWPFHSPQFQSEAVFIFGFYISDNMNSYVLFSEVDQTGAPVGAPISSEFPSMNNVNDQVAVLQLAPVGVHNYVMVTAVSAQQTFLYSTWNPGTATALDNPADGFMDWTVLDLGGRVLQIVPWAYRDPEEEGVLVVMEDSTLLSIEVDAHSQTGWGVPRVVVDENSNPIMGVASVAFDRLSLQDGRATGAHLAVVSRYGAGEASTLDYKENGLWVLSQSWTPFLQEYSAGQDAPEQGYPASTASNQANAIFNGSAPSNNQNKPLPPGIAQNTFAHLPFDDPAWTQTEPYTFSDNDLITLVQTLYMDINSQEKLISFRRAIDRGGLPAIESLSNLLQNGQISIHNAQQAAAIFSTVLDGQTTEASTRLLGIAIATEGWLTNEVKASAIYQTMSMTCFPVNMSRILGSLAAGSPDADPKDTADLVSAATVALGAFASKPPCPFDAPGGILPPHHIVSLLGSKLADAEDPHNQLKAIYGLANTQHPGVIDHVIEQVNHDIPAVRVGAIRALANVNTTRATIHLAHHALTNSEPMARRAGLEALLHHQHEDPLVATQALLKGLYNPNVRRKNSDLAGMKKYFKSKSKARGSDRRMAKIGSVRVGIVQQSVESQKQVGSAIFTPLSWSKDWSGSNAKVIVGLDVESDFGANGASFYAGSFVQGNLFGTDFDLASAGVYGAWTDQGLLSFSMWMAVFLFDFSKMAQVPYYVVDIQYQTQTAVGIAKGDPCTLTVPYNGPLSVLSSYGIPLIANINLHVELVGWFEVQYGFQIKSQSLDVTNFLPGQIVGYARPGAGIGGQISANVQVLVASGGIQGNMDFASISIPVGGGMTVNRLSPFTVGFGDSISVTGTFLKGSVNLVAEIWNCCCWSCWFKCCFRCGGSCNSRWTYVLITWNGIAGFTLPIDNRQNLCVTMRSAANLPPPGRDAKTFELSLLKPPEISSPVVGGIFDNMDDEAYCDCVGLYNLRSRKRPRDSSGFQNLELEGTNASVESESPPWGLETLAPILSTATVPGVGPYTFTYDCATYPEVCQNTICYQKWYGKPLDFTWDDNVVNRRSKSLSRLKTTVGKDRDEVPMNKCIEGGCCARIQALDKTQNAAHGGSFCGFLGSIGKSGVRPITGKFSCSVSLSSLATDKATCKGLDYRWVVGGSSWFAPFPKTCPFGCTIPLYAVNPGIPALPGSSLTLTLAGQTHPQLAYAFGDIVEAFNDPSQEHDHMVFHSSRLQNLTVGTRALIVAGKEVEDAHSYFERVADDNNRFRVRLERGLLDLNETDHFASVYMKADFSYLVYDDEKSYVKHQRTSSADITFNVTDPVVLQRLVESPGAVVLQGGRRVLQSPVEQGPPTAESGTMSDDKPAPVNVTIPTAEDGQPSVRNEMRNIWRSMRIIVGQFVDLCESLFLSRLDEAIADVGPQATSLSPRELLLSFLVLILTLSYFYPFIRGTLGLGGEPSDGFGRPDVGNGNEKKGGNKKK